MRKIMFRGKRIDNGEWVSGYYGELTDGLTTKSYIMTNTLSFNPSTGVYFTDHPVDPETVGQYTGLNDLNSEEVYEGDIIDFKWQEDSDIGAVKFIEGCFKINGMKRHMDIPLFLRYPTYLVIGNIYQNPELLNS